MCDEKVECFSRVCGYFRPVSNWNAGKQKEFQERKFFKLDVIEKFTNEASKELLRPIPL